jgi:hypothetical protein
MSTIMPMMMRMILRAPLLPLLGGGAVTGRAAGVDAAPATAALADPHLAQKFVPGVRVAPQELQNAIKHLVG